MVYFGFCRRKKVTCLWGVFFCKFIVNRSDCHDKRRDLNDRQYARIHRAKEGREALERRGYTSKQLQFNVKVCHPCVWLGACATMQARLRTAMHTKRLCRRNQVAALEVDTDVLKIDVVCAGCVHGFFWCGGVYVEACSPVCMCVQTSVCAWCSWRVSTRVSVVAGVWREVCCEGACVSVFKGVCDNTERRQTTDKHRGQNKRE